MRRIVALDSGVIDIDLGDGDWVKIRTRQTAGDRAYIQKHATFMVFNAKGEVAQTHFDMGQGNLCALERMLVAWGGPGFCVINHDAEDAHAHDEKNGCRSIELNRDHIEGMDDETSQKLINAINEKALTPKKGSDNP